MNAQEYMEKALLLEKNFTPENKAYFEKLRNYLAAASFFYDEKEVRLVPHQEDIKGYELCLFESQYQDFKKRYKKSILGKNGVNFSFSDVKYIIVGNENNRKEVQGVLAKQTEDCSHIVILTKQQVLGDIVGNNHNEELPMLNIEPIKTSELALKIGKEFFKK